MSSILVCFFVPIRGQINHRGGVRAKSPDRGPCTLSKKNGVALVFLFPLAPIFGMGGQKKGFLMRPRKLPKDFWEPWKIFWLRKVSGDKGCETKKGGIPRGG